MPPSQNTEVRQPENRNGRVLVVMVAREEQCQFECVDRHFVEILAVFRQTAKREICREPATGLFGNQFGKFLDMFSKRPAFAPEPNVS